VAETATTHNARHQRARVLDVFPRVCLPEITERAGILKMFGPLFIGTLVGVGCRVMVVGPRLGTLRRLRGNFRDSSAVARLSVYVKY